MKDIKPGCSGRADLVVGTSDLALNVGSGSLEVFATPSMIALMEKSACDCIQQYLENDETTVGTELCIKHISATPTGMNVHAVAELAQINGRELVFNVNAYDNAGLIGSGTHKRFLVFAEKFMSKTLGKLNG